MKGYLCLNQGKMQVTIGRDAMTGEEIKLFLSMPKDCLAMLAVFRTKKAAREVHGPKAQLMEVDVPDKKEAK